MYELLINSLYKLLDNREKRNTKKMEYFIKDTYITVEKIYSDYYSILKYAEHELQNGNMSIDEAVIYFDEKRLPFKAARAHIRGVMKHPYYHKRETLCWFSIGVFGVLQGGLHDVTESLLHAEIPEKAIILHDEVEMKGYHTIVDIIKKYDRNNANSLFYADRFKSWNSREEIESSIKQNLLLDIKKQEDKIDQSWQIVCDYYTKLII